MKESNKELLEEVMDEIKSALEDPRGISKHQRRLAFSLSSGSVTLIETYLNEINILKPGAKINHLWLKKKKENVLKLLDKHLTSPIKSIEKLNKLLDFAYQIENDRNNLAYGNTVPRSILKEKINIFLNLKREVENV